MSDDNKQGLKFLDVVVAVIVGLAISQWINDHRADIGAFPWWILLIIYIVGGTLIEQWRERKWQKKNEKEAAAYAEEKIDEEKT